MKTTKNNQEKFFSDSIGTGKHKYFFDVKKSSIGSFYLSISETKSTAEGFERHHIIVFDNNIDYFVNIINRAYKEFQVLRKTKGKPVIRLNHEE